MVHYLAALAGVILFDCVFIACKFLYSGVRTVAAEYRLKHPKRLDQRDWMQDFNLWVLRRGRGRTGYRDVVSCLPPQKSRREF
jgi:hypothetical protein